MAVSSSAKIFVDVNDEINFVVEKILLSDQDRVILVVPQNAIVVSSLVSMQILAKQVTKTKKVVVLVTEDEFGLQLASRAGISATQKVSNVTPEMWEAAVIKKQKLIAQVEERKKALLIDRGAIVPEPAALDLDGDVEYEVNDKGELEEIEGDGLDATTYLETEPAIEPIAVEDTLDEDAETLVVPAVDSLERENEIGEVDELCDSVKEDEKKDMGADERTDKEPEDVLGPIHRKRLEPKLSHVGAFTIVGGGDIASFPGRGNIDPLNMTKEVGERTLHSKTAPASFTGRDWTKYTAEGKGDKPNVLRARLGGIFNKGTKEGRSVVLGGNHPGRKKKIIILSGILAAILFLLGGGYVLAFQLSSVDVFITLATTEVPIEEQITADPGVTEVDLETLSIPVEPIKDDTLSTSADDKASGAGVRGDKASGVIEIWNYLEQEITVPQGTAIVSTQSNLVYELQAATTIAAAEKSGVIVTPGGMEEELWVQAQEVGADYNISSSESEFTFKVGDYATSEVVGKLFREIKGGTSEDFVAVSQEDIDRVKTKLTETLTEQGKTKLQNLVPVGYKLLTGTEVFTETEVTSVPQMGEAADNFSVSLKGEMTGMIVKEDDLRAVIEELLSRNVEVADDFELDNLTTIAVANVVKQEDGKITFTIASSGSLKSSITREDIQAQLAGKTLSEAGGILSGLSEVTEYRMEFFPQIVPESIRYVPSDIGRIKVRID